MVCEIHLEMTQTHALSPIPTDMFAGSCPDDWHAHGTRCYKYFDDFMIFAEAEDTCAKQGAHVASIDSEETNTFIHKEIGDIVGTKIVEIFILL